ncbi:MAG TPA: DUF2480 family protein [Phaeodactylibacter sp.]|nr:DUF2480 family protein [Phaeodactylibacter sp.]
MDKPLVNRVAKSGLITISPEDYFPKGEIKNFDLKDYLFQGLILREKEFRTALKEHDWSAYKDQHVLVFCSTDAIIPMWAYMLVSSYLREVARSVFQGTPDEFIKHEMLRAIENIREEDYRDRRIILKGCGEKPVPPAAYAALVWKLQPVAKSIMFGEPCSTVPVFKKKT